MLPIRMLKILKGIDIENKIILGKELTHGLGAWGEILKLGVKLH